MRAILLASAIASLNRLSRRAAASIQDLRPYFCQLCGPRRTERAAWTNSIRKYQLPRLEIAPRMVRPPGAALDRNVGKCLLRFETGCPVIDQRYNFLGS